MELQALGNHPGYLAGIDGVIYSLWTRHKGIDTNRIPYPLKSVLSKGSPYFQVSLRSPDGVYRVKTHLVHQLVCMAFHGPRPVGDYQVSHLNGDSKDNRASNLKWETRKENEARKKEHGTLMHGGRNGHSKLSDDKVMELRRLAVLGMSTTKLAQKFQISQSHACDIKNGKSWTHLLG